MTAHAEVAIREAEPAELGALLGVQHRAFGRIAASLGIEPSELPPLRESVEDLEALFAAGMRFFVAVTDDGTVVGGVRGEQRDAAVEIGRLVVDEGWLRQGIATRLMEALESAYPSALRFELFTGADASAPLALYAKMGYVACRSTYAGPVELVWLEKTTSMDRR